jgi:hypothetical protein
MYASTTRTALQLRQSVRGVCVVRNQIVPGTFLDASALVEPVETTGFFPPPIFFTMLLDEFQ